MDKHVAEIQLPILESLNKFFDLYPNGIYTYVPLRRVMKLGSLDEEDTETDIKKLTEMKNSLFTTMSPAQSDGAALIVLENNLKEIKKHLVEDEVNKRSQKDIKHFDDEYMPTFKGATYGYGASQERALEILCSFYSIDVDTSKMREKKHK